MTNPIDVVKTRLMTDRLRSQSVAQCARECYSQEGMAGFRRGIGLRTGSCALITALLFVSYEKMKSYFAEYLYEDRMLIKY